MKNNTACYCMKILHIGLHLVAHQHNELVICGCNRKNTLLNLLKLTEVSRCSLTDQVNLSAFPFPLGKSNFSHTLKYGPSKN